MTVFITAFLATIFAATAPSFASEEHPVAHMTAHPGAIICLVIFILSYVGVLLEEKTHLRKSKPVMLGAGLIWVTIGLMAGDYNIDHHVIRAAIFHGLGEFSSLMLFLLSAMTYISALQERRVFATLRAKLVAAGFNLRQMFWIDLYSSEDGALPKTSQLLADVTTFTYGADCDCGTDVFTYTLTDGDGDADTATLTLVCVDLVGPFANDADPAAVRRRDPCQVAAGGRGQGKAVLDDRSSRST